MASKSQRKATRAHRRRAAARGLVRVEVQAPKSDARLIRVVAETLRGKVEEAEALRSTLAQAQAHPEARTAFDVFGSELSDQVFAGALDQPRQRGWREVDFLRFLIDTNIISEIRKRERTHPKNVAPHRWRGDRHECLHLR